MWVPGSVRVLAAAMVAALVLAACSTSEREASPSSTVVRGTVSSSVDGRVEPGRFGDGRALSARYAPAVDRLVVLTTVGLAVRDGWSGSSRLLERNSRDVGQSALSPDGEWFALVDGLTLTLEVWSLSEGIQVFSEPIGETTGAVHSVAFDADSSQLTVSAAASVVRWSLDGEPTVLIEAPTAGALGAASIAADGRRIVVPVAGASTPSFLEWTDPAGVRSVEVGLAQNEQLGRTALSNDGSFVVVEVESASGPVENSLAVVDLATGIVREPRIGTGSLLTSTWTLGPGDRPMIVEPATAIVFEIDGTVVGRGDLTNDAAAVSVSAPQDGQTFVTLHDDGSLVVWSADGDRLELLSSTAGTLREVVRPDGAHVLTVGYSGLVDRWAVPEGTSAGPIDRYAHGAVNSVAISGVGDRIAIAHEGGRVDLSDSDTGEIQVQLDHDGKSIDAVAFSPDSSAVVTGVGERLGLEAFDDTVTVWDANSGEARSDIGGEGENVAGCSYFRNLVRYSPDGKLIAAGSHDFTVTLYSADDLTPVRTLPSHANAVLDIAFSRNGELLATSSEDLLLRIWDVASGDLIAEHEAALGGYWAIAFAPDAATLATIGATGSVSVIGVDDGQVVRVFDDSANWLSNVVFSSDGSMLAAGGKSDDVLIWSTADGAVVDRLAGHADRVNAVAISDDGSFLVSGSEDGTARRWSLRS